MMFRQISSRSEPFAIEMPRESIVFLFS
jgi:hypothetical protein